MLMLADVIRLRKEWFLLLVREVFDPEHGMYVSEYSLHWLTTTNRAVCLRRRFSVLLL